jgi:segregation and condensation protein B
MWQGSQCGFNGAWSVGGVAWPAHAEWLRGADYGWRRLWQERNLPQGAQAAAAALQDGDAGRRDGRTARIEALLFLAREPLSSRKIAQMVNLADGTAARTLVRRLNRMLEDSASAFRVEEVAGGFQLMTRPMFGPWLRLLLQRPVKTRLSTPALETLAVVAYRQPVLRAEVEAIRGVQSGDILRQLMERDLVRISGRADELGRPLTYGTTKRFLQVFGLRHLDELPRAEILRTKSAPRNADEHLPGDSQPDQAFQPNKCINEEDAK